MARILEMIALILLLLILYTCVHNTQIDVQMDKAQRTTTTLKCGN